MIGGELRARPQQVVIGDGVVGARLGGEIQALRPFDLDRRHREKQRPGKIAGVAPMPDWRSPLRRRDRRKVSDSAAEDGAAPRKSMVPAIRVFSPSVGKRVMARMPDWPAVSLAQLSVLPAPSEVTTPSPVTTTIGRPNLSLVVAITCSPSADPFHQREAFAPPMTDAGHQDLAQFPAHRPFQPGRVTGRKQTAMAKRHHGERDIHGKLRLQPMPEI